jgi:hypothetical protein
MEVLSAATKNRAKAWATPNKKGELPLHVLLQHEWWLQGSSIPLCLDRFPGAISLRTQDCDLPWHLLFKCFGQNFNQPTVSSSLETLIQNLVKRLRPRKRKEFQDGLYVDRANGDSPLHLAIHHMFMIPSVIGKMVQSNPQMVQHRNLDGQLLLHVACQVAAASSPPSDPDTALEKEDQTLDILRLLIAAWPVAVEIKCQNQKLLPFHYACLGPFLKPNLIRYLLTV